MRMEHGLKHTATVADLTDNTSKTKKETKIISEEEIGKEEIVEENLKESKEDKNQKNLPKEQKEDKGFKKDAEKRSGFGLKDAKKKNKPTSKSFFDDID